MPNESLMHGSAKAPTPRPGPFLAKVVSNFDPTYMGTLEVEILRPSGAEGTQSVFHAVKYMSPFYGVTNVNFIKKSPDNYTNTQQSYGMWMVPPDVGSTVIIMFIDGDPKRGYWFGCVPDESMNFMVPGHAAISNTVEGTYPRSPAGEYNKLTNTQVGDPETVQKPMSPLADVLNKQGLILDDIRGITTSSARREAPSMVFGISTPGPLDKRPGANTANYGKPEYVITNAPVSRLGGSTFVMDDGDAAFTRKTPASSGPPEYAAVETGDTTGDPTIPHNELVRIRTRTGHQILLHNSEDLIYIGNARGTTWIELTSNGKIDIYAKDSISVHTQNDLNFTADRDINFTAANNINLNAKNIFAQSTNNVEIKVGAEGKITAATNMHVSATGGKVNVQASGDVNVKAGGRYTQNAAGYYSLPGGGGTAAVTATAAAASVAPKAARVPLAEPWAGHENLDPKSCTPAPAATATPKQPTPAKWKQYTTATDTFAKYKGNTPADGRTS
jgi:uncharacterized protein (DUF2345 family)